MSMSHTVTNQEPKENGYRYTRAFRSEGNSMFHIIRSSNHRFHNVTGTCTTSVSHTVTTEHHMHVLLPYNYFQDGRPNATMLKY